MQFGTNHLAHFQFRHESNRTAPTLDEPRRGEAQYPTRSSQTTSLRSSRLSIQTKSSTLHSKIELLNLSPAGGFFVAFQVAFYAGLFLASPFILYFVGPVRLARTKINEKKYLFRGLGIGFSFVFFGCGLLLLYPDAHGVWQLPLSILNGSDFLLQWRAGEYIGFICKFMLGMGLGFEMPVVILMLVRLGLVTADQLAKFRAYMVVINLVLGAVLTTPEVLTQLMMFVPLQLLYEVSIWIARSWERQAKKREAEETSIQPKD